ncbi:MAG: J domain-containing protein [Dehalococcoidia bacterium]
MQDYHRTLEINPTADAEAVTAAYRRLMRKHHPS